LNFLAEEALAFWRIQLSAIARACPKRYGSVLTLAKVAGRIFGVPM